MGFGVAKAGGDAKALAAALAETPDDIDAALARYDAERQPFGHRVMLHARKLGTYFGVGLRTEADYRMQRVLSNPFGQMDWIAVPDFLDARASA
jgi:2-polyprenyl-6-methoxyphenol hydroxylase-like FAD-dependent oxidoreductase